MVTAHVRTADWAIVVAYLTAIVVAGLVFMRRNRSATAYFNGGGNLPWWVVSLSIFMSLFSPLTLLAIPALVYSTDMGYMPIFVAAVLAVPVATRWLLPFFRSLNMTSAYEYLETRFNLACRLFASAAFILFMISLTAVVAYLPAVALAAVTGIDVNVAVVAVMVAVIAFCAFGGLAAMAWMDFVQAILMVAAMAAIVFVLVSGTDGGLSGCIAKGIESGKCRIFDFSPDWSRPVFWVVAIGGFVGTFVSYASDQRVIQRYMAVKDVPAAVKSIHLQIVASLVTSSLCFFIGLALWTYYSSAGTFPSIAKNDQILPVFIANELPVGLAGVSMAAIAAAALSTLAANLNAASAAFTTDFYRRLLQKGRRDERKELVCGRICTVLAGFLGGGLAIVLANGDLASAYEQFQRYVGMLTAGVAALFFMGLFLKRVNGVGAMCGLVASYAAVFWIDFASWSGKPHLLLYGFIGMAVCVGVAMLTSPPAKK